MVIVLMVASACGGDAQEVDARFSTPERTVATLFQAYGIEQMSQAETVRRLGEHGAFSLRDRAAFEACFLDLERPGGEGMGGYVFGLLAAGREDLRYETVEDHGYVIPREGIRIVMDRDGNGAYRINLRASVPENVRRGLIQVESNAAHRTP